MTVTHQFKDNYIKKHRWGPERIVEIPKKKNTNLGLSIVGGKLEVIDDSSGSSSDINGIFIRHIETDSPAGITGDLKVGDHILEINGINVRNSTYDQAVETIRNAENSIRFLVQSFELDKSLSTRSETKHSIDLPNESATKNVTKNMAKSISIKSSSQDIEVPVISPEEVKPSEMDEEKETPKTKNDNEDSDESSDSEDERMLEGNIMIKGGVEISRKSAGNVKRSNSEIAADPEQEDEYGYTLQKIKKKYGQMGGELVLAKLVRSGRDIGLALAGHKDRMHMAVFVCGISSIVTYQDNVTLKQGDEILEVNGNVFQGKSHLNAAAIMKKMPAAVLKIVALRQSSNNNTAVDPVTYFPAAFDDMDQYSQFEDVRKIPMQKGQYGLGIMIVEGKHADVGKGIFASDIQEGSVAEKAGLKVGDMILGVNSDTLLECSYDEATNRLKRAEGLVILTVCNPNKNKKSEANDASNKDGGAKNEKGVDSSKINSVEPKAAEVKPMTIELEISSSSGVKFTIAGGTDTPCGGIFVIDTYFETSTTPDPIQCGDQILDFGEENFKTIEYNKAQVAILSVSGKVKVTLLRDEKANTEAEVELQKKSGKGAGLSIMGYKNGKGAYISELLEGGSALESEKLAIGDRIISVGGQDCREQSVDDIAVLMKASSSILLKIVRYKAK